MLTYVIASTIVAFLSGWVWYQVLFPKAAAETAGSEEAARSMRGRNLLIVIIALIILSAAVGTFIRNRHVLDVADAVKLSVKMWFGFFLPVALVAWAYTRGSLTTLVASLGYWLIVAVEFSLLASWFLLK